MSFRKEKRKPNNNYIASIFLHGIPVKTYNGASRVQIEQRMKFGAWTKEIQSGQQTDIDTDVEEIWIELTRAYGGKKPWLEESTHDLTSAAATTNLTAAMASRPPHAVLPNTEAPPRSPCRRGQ